MYISVHLQGISERKIILFNPNTTSQKLTDLKFRDVLRESNSPYSESTTAEIVNTRLHRGRIHRHKLAYTAIRNFLHATLY